jgi:hypothetical protein
MHRYLIALSLVSGMGWVAGCHREIRYVPPPPQTGEKVTDIKDAWVRLYDKKGFSGRTLTIRYPQDMPDLGHATADNGEANFNDVTSSMKWQIPDGWVFILFEDPNFKEGRFPLIGTTKVESDPGPIAGKPSSGRWERRP